MDAVLDRFGRGSRFSQSDHGEELEKGLDELAEAPQPENRAMTFPEMIRQRNGKDHREGFGIRDFPGGSRESPLRKYGPTCRAEPTRGRWPITEAGLSPRPELDIGLAWTGFFDRHRLPSDQLGDSTTGSRSTC